MNQAKINELYELAHVVHEIRYEGSVVDPTIVSVHKQRVFDRYLFAELIVRQCGYHADVFESLGCPVDMDPTETKPSDYIKKHFGVEE